jgi:hypothetical protein
LARIPPIVSNSALNNFYSLSGNPNSFIWLFTAMSPFA